MKEFFNQIWQMVVDSRLLSIVGAVLLLLVGWLIASILARKVSRLIRTISPKAAMLPDGTPAPMEQADTLAGKVIYAIIMLFTVLGCFSILRLEAAATPLQEFVGVIAQYVPNIAGAVILAVAAWIIAGLVRVITKAAVIKSRLHERLAAQTGKDPETTAEYTAKTMYYTVFLFFLPAILNALKIYGITAPLQSMFEKVITYIPNLAAAAAILLVGLWVAGIIRRAVAGLVVISQIDAFGEKMGVSKLFGNGGIAAMAGVVCYVLVAIPVVISSLTALKIDALSNSVTGFFNKLLNATGDIIGAALLIFAAILAGSFVAALVTQFVSALGFDRLMNGILRKNDENTAAPSAVVGKLTFIAIVILAVLSACEIMGFTQLAMLIRTFAAFGGNVLLSIAVLLIGVWLANVAADALEGKCSTIMISGVRIGVIIFTAAIAIGNLNIGDSIVQIAFTLILGAICVAAAVAFGIGGREAAAKLLNDWAEKIRK
ncbi:MAG: mechanosensitive ion channel [Lentisphaeria bacterium]|nr:mechanosensitive ion channel [Lentisphaeria bacterium]